MLDPVELGDARFDSIGANYLFHCLPGGLEWKVSDGGVEPPSLPRANGVLFGSTILGRGVGTTCSDAALCVSTTGRESSRTSKTTSEGLERGLASQLTDVEVEVVGAVALFAGRA